LRRYEKNKRAEIPPARCLFTYFAPLLRCRSAFEQNSFFPCLKHRNKYLTQNMIDVFVIPLYADYLRLMSIKNHQSKIINYLRRVYQNVFQD